MYGIYANIGGILMVNVTIYSIHGSYGIYIYILYIIIYIWSPTELWGKKNVQLRQAAPASDFSIIGFFPIRVQNIPEVIRTFFFP